MNIRLPEEIQTNRLLMRSPVIADANAIFAAYTQDTEVCRFMVWTPHESESATLQFITSCIDAWHSGLRFAYVIAGRELNTPVGMLEARMRGTTVDIGYVLARSHWGQGLMPEAIAALADVALSDAALFRVQATCDIENIPSQRALEKAGFIREGRLERYTIHPNISPEPRSCFMYAKTR